MEITDLFGEGAIFDNGLLSIPLTNLEAIGLSDSNKIKAVVAVILLAQKNLQKFYSNILIDSDNFPLSIDGGDNFLIADNIVEQASIVFIDNSYGQNTITWNYLITFNFPVA